MLGDDGRFRNDGRLHAELKAAKNIVPICNAYVELCTSNEKPERQPKSHDRLWLDAMRASEVHYDNSGSARRRGLHQGAVTTCTVRSLRCVTIY